MNNELFVKERVKKFYWEDDFNCATVTFLILSEKFNVKLSKQVIDSAVGMHGAGEYGAQCGLVEGTLLFLGIIGRLKGIPDIGIIKNCKSFAESFESEFSSLLCSVLRPEGFSENNPPHLCEKLTCKAVCFGIEFASDFIKNETE